MNEEKSLTLKSKWLKSFHKMCLLRNALPDKFSGGLGAAFPGPVHPAGYRPAAFLRGEGGWKQKGEWA